LSLIREYLKACRWLPYGPIGRGKEGQKIELRYLYATAMQGHQALAELLDPFLGLSLVRQRPTAQYRTERPKERKSLCCGEADRGFSVLLACLHLPAVLMQHGSPAQGGAHPLVL